ncbi:DUF3078 domain-containing protein [Sphingobacterium spiritivorum]|uniref:Outer membrane insertion signal domain protein n=1 Tax=Sphingobacterium spiritivorum ATCC 33861 TaxID=525373 RepID=D7VPA6_SPHSI|nr:DUF3078 domain-containing protein [Sphingobacterium spiritivorum]EFK57753.1 hypothetical protein HMPREF0766_12826 [Sphingobacterium spiritivorum ATCC 33861]QQT36215.1 DUF3078 domain-containing protein [Sphingobacterium spiritivorum]WQD32952.1 DUF3078 domain-containing protein [Sphingobacterium spiritivorum]SUJ17371.1 Protein of uncharacterised function (DUF3078) [Sphingobacterium spiritivorum]
MKKLKLTIMLLLSAFSIATYAQQEGADSTRLWTIKGENTFLINQSSFSNWAAGGVNSFAGNLIFNYDFNYKKDRWSWDNKVLAAYGQTFQKETDWRKNDDRFAISSLLGYQAKERWLYTFFMNFNTQFAKGYKYDSNNARTLLSTAFAPAYLSFGPGMAYKESDNFKINISPAAARFVFVTNDSLSNIGAFGVDPGKKSRFEFGASLDAYYKKEIMENITFENILKLYSNYLEDPQNVDVDYTANLVMKVNKWITVNAGVQLIYDDNTLIPKDNGAPGSERPALQVKQILGAGITYKF